MTWCRVSGASKRAWRGKAAALYHTAHSEADVPVLVGGVLTPTPQSVSQGTHATEWRAGLCRRQPPVFCITLQRRAPPHPREAAP